MSTRPQMTSSYICDPPSGPNRSVPLRHRWLACSQGHAWTTALRRSWMWMSSCWTGRSPFFVGWDGVGRVGVAFLLGESEFFCRTKPRTKSCGEVEMAILRATGGTGYCICFLGFRYLISQLDEGILRDHCPRTGFCNVPWNQAGEHYIVGYCWSFICYFPIILHHIPIMLPMHILCFSCYLSSHIISIPYHIIPYYPYPIISYNSTRGALVGHFVLFKHA